MESIEDELLNWAVHATQNDRYLFLKRFLDLLPEDELNQVSNHASKAKKRRKRPSFGASRTAVSIQVCSVSAPVSSVSVPVCSAPVPVFSVSVPVCSVSAPVSSVPLESDSTSAMSTVDTVLPTSVNPTCIADLAVSVPQFALKNAQSINQSVSEPESSVPVPETIKFTPEEFMSKPLGFFTTVGESPKWFHKYLLRDIVSMDVEKVEYPLTNPGRKKFELKAAIVSIVNYNGEVIYKTKIKHNINDFRVTTYSWAVNGITPHSLQHGEPIAIVKERIREILFNKLVIMLQAEGDFSSLDLPIASFDVFDCVDFWYRKKLSSKNKPIIESLGLRSLCQHYFKADIQPNGQIHDATTDARWTMKLFKECFTTHPNNSFRVNPEASNEIPHYKD